MPANGEGGPSSEAPPAALDVGSRPLSEVVRWLRARLREQGVADLHLPDPDTGAGAWPGERRPDGAPQRGWRDWLDLAEAVGARMSTPRELPGAGPARLHARFVLLGAESDLHGHRSRPEDRYGSDGDFSRIRKMELPGFLLPLHDALAFAAPVTPERVLVVGCHRGDELDALASAVPPVPNGRVTGVDRDPGALEVARERHPSARFVHADVAALPEDLGRYGLVVAIDVLQSPELDGPAVLRTLVRDHAERAGGLVIGLPCSRFRDGGLTWGARTRNFSEPDLSLLVRDLAGHRRYLHQQGYRTRIGGRYDLLLTAHRPS